MAPFINQLRHQRNKHTDPSITKLWGLLISDPWEQTMVALLVRIFLCIMSPGVSPTCWHTLWTLSWASSIQ